MSQDENIPRNDLPGIELPLNSVSSDHYLEHEQLIESFQLFWGTVFFEEAQSHAEDDDAKNEVSGEAAPAFPWQKAYTESQYGREDQNEYKIIDQLFNSRHHGLITLWCVISFRLWVRRLAASESLNPSGVVLSFRSISEISNTCHEGGVIFYPSFAGITPIKPMPFVRVQCSQLILISLPLLCSLVKDHYNF
jgi:hypothetical protein